jgi:holo-[acyl-carrier protein] synthase
MSVHRRSADLGKARPSIQQRRAAGRLTVGIDVISVDEVGEALHHFGDRYVRRVFTAGEATYCRAASGSTVAARFAVRFAAKEAAIKALRPASPWTDWLAIEVRRHKSGRCALVLHGKAASLAASRGIQSLSLSMSHDGDHAAAIVVGLPNARTSPRER